MAEKQAIVDLRSDTITKPTPAIREAMANAEVGDDTFVEDPTIRALEERIAELLGYEAALYVASGQMGNQVALRAHSQPGESVIAHSGAHILFYETGAPAAISGLLPRTIDSAEGWFTAEDAAKHILPANIHHARNRIIALENTHNRCGGAIWQMEHYKAVAQLAHENNMIAHLDGARLWNACIGSGTSPADWCADVDSVSVCFSKGLGAPVGSAIGGSREFIEECRFYRKMFGGQMRQAGIIAAGALYAVNNHYERLADDHANAKMMARILNESEYINCAEPQTNIVMLDTADGVPAASVVEEAADTVACFAIGPQRIRLVTHLDVDSEGCNRAAEALLRSADAIGKGGSAYA